MWMWMERHTEGIVFSRDRGVKEVLEDETWSGSLGRIFAGMIPTEERE
jgi:hypothetical protein